MRRLVELDVPCLEHATSITPVTAALVAERGTHVVPTLALLHGIAQYGAGLGFPPRPPRGWLAWPRRPGTRWRRCTRAGVVLSVGSGVVGPLDRIQTTEFGIRADLLPAADAGAR